MTVNLKFPQTVNDTNFFGVNPVAIKTSRKRVMQKRSIMICSKPEL